MFKINIKDIRKIFFNIFYSLHAFIMITCIVFSHHSNVFAMELKNSEIDNDSVNKIVYEAKKDKDIKNVILNVIALTSTFVDNIRHMLDNLKEINKYADYAKVPGENKIEYPEILFELPGEKRKSILFEELALDFDVISQGGFNKESYQRNEETVQSEKNRKRIKDILKYRRGQYNNEVDQNQLLLYCFFGDNHFKRFKAFPKHKKVFDQDYFSPEELHYFVKSKKNLKNVDHVARNNFNNANDSDIVNYFLFLYYFNRLLDFERQISLFNVVKLCDYVNEINDVINNDVLLVNSKRPKAIDEFPEAFYCFFKTTCKQSSYFKAYIPLLINPSVHIKDAVLCDTGKIQKNLQIIDHKKIKKSIELLKKEYPIIHYFDQLFNSLFSLCFTIHKNGVLPVNLNELIGSIEEKFNFGLTHVDAIDNLYLAYKYLLTENVIAHNHFWGPLSYQKNIYLPKKVFEQYVSSTTKEMMSITLEKKLFVEKNPDKVARELLLELDKKKKNWNKKQSRIKKNIHISTEKLSPRNLKNSPKSKVQRSSETNNTEVKNDIHDQDPVVELHEGQQDAVNKSLVNSKNIIMPVVVSPAQESLLFNRKYYERLTDPVSKELHDHYHGMPAKMIAEIINKGFSLPSPKDEKATVYFGVAAVKTVIGRYVYYIPFVMVHEGAIFHVGLHKESNAVKILGNMASKNIEKLKKAIDFPLLQRSTENKHKVKQAKTKGVLSSALASYNLSVSFEDFNTYFPCREIRPSVYENTKMYSLPNGEQLIHLNSKQIKS